MANKNQRIILVVGVAYQPLKMSLKIKSKEVVLSNTTSVDVASNILLPPDH
jgi:hypothetical protein